ncbi:hypothetical protein P175DRAFT_0491819 [Aspergillus ochraceoroseus IBT 24754]|uniref:DUF7582 domain-containing protein n=3 Tax=Aspergillus subgen. Nidulantes TaxID=2720870 RepID=A0A0F8UIS4_9EURO|nr:uncharacterized protein P175DRAFT_0491819 [Aspergillus ochraceoroseus IBT 24754]KKK17502.1 hypothetical protein AOCH_003876 [Aspergillus ochraceoroseus]KKK19473.1 hypothetical protein ARAM_005906 [Aspergillus rambellii]PTU23467.1 hypothetical protein P175DRAFT_0491819 [Aspergillus ochraceoroseus IBT 24754]
MAGLEQTLDANGFHKALQALDEELGKFDFIVAFAPIKLITVGGFLAVNYLKNRESTKDMNYLLDPEWANDDDIKKPLEQAIFRVSKRLQCSENWANEDVAFYVTKETRMHLFKKAQKQNIILFRGDHLIILAAPIKWALKRKIRWMFAANRDKKADLDMSDILAMLKCIRDRKGRPLNREHLRTQNANPFDIVPDASSMEHIAGAYREKYKEEIFV